jgi:predicted phosphate transport protein (TIGR00153 family)
MSLTSILKLFQPKDRIFYGLFEKVVETNTLMGQKLKELVNTPDYSDRQVIINQIEALEHTNDENTHDIFTELGRNFITPFDREDIHALASSLDDIADYIYSASKKINFYKVDPMEQGFQKMAEVISQTTETLHGAVMELRNMKNVSNITSALVKINSLENQADDIYDMSIEKLFDSEPDVKEVIKKREIYQVMEIVTDKCEDAANVIESIVIKYA